MKPEKVFKRYDIRGKYPEEIDKEFARTLGKAIGTWSLKNSTDRVLITKDTKDSSKILKTELIAGLKSTGIEVFDAGTGPTDYNALNSYAYDAVGIQVTSSHLPVDFNGFKLIYPEGNGFVNEDLYEVQDIFRSRKFREQSGSIENVESSCYNRYKQRASEYFKKILERIDRKIVYESMGGAGQIFLPDLLEEFGAEIIDISDSDEIMDPPNPKPEHLDHVEEQVNRTEADMGLVTDMDADRIAVYYNGEWIDGNELFIILASIIQPERIVASVDTSLMLENSFSGEVIYTRVGDPFVAEKMIDIDADFSGEPNGHYSFPSFVAYNSGTMAGLLIAGSNIGDIEFSKFHNNRSSVEVKDKEKALNKLVEKVKDRFEVISEIDGIKFRKGDATVLVRSSGSSQKLRIISDAPTKKESYNVLQETRKMID